MLKEASKQFLPKVRIWILILLGSLTWSLTMIKSGLVYPFGLGFWGANGHDGIWHIALAESLSRWSFQMPVFAGFSLQNYHLGFDLLLALLHKITSIPTVNLYFQLLPPILSFFVGYLTYKFVFGMTKSGRGALWSTFFVYFGGSFGFLIGKGESAFWSQQAISTLINPPFALSLILILSGLISLLRYEKTHTTYYFLLTALFFGILIEIKIYAGVLVLGGLFVAGVYEWFLNHKSQVVKIFLFSLIISLILFLLFERGSTSLLVWQPFWFLETMMGLTDRVGWLKFYSAMTSYKSGHIWLKMVPAYLVAFVIFYVGNLGTRIVKEFLVWKWIKNIKLIGWFGGFAASIIVAGVIFPIFFLQKGTPWNTIQFFYYSLFFSSILAGIAVDSFLNNSKLNTAVLYGFKVGIILLTIPTTLLTLDQVYLPSRPPAMLSNGEISALSFLSKEPGGVVLSFPFDSVAAKDAEANPPRPLYLYASTAYVSAFSGHPTFLEDEINLDITGYDWPSRRAEVASWYRQKDQVKARQFLKDNNIRYIYWVKPQRALLGEGQLNLKNIFENKQVIIYQVD